MSRRLLSFSLALGMLAAACSKPSQPSVSLGSGRRFVPQIADFLDNTGVDPSMTLGPDGTPYLISFAFLEKLSEGELPPTRPINSPSLPNVSLIWMKDGIWSRSAVAMEAQIPNVILPGPTPASVKSVKDLTADNVTGTAVAADAQGKLHVVWAGNRELWYADDVSGGFAAKQITLRGAGKLVTGASGAAYGPSIAVDSSGTPWIAWEVKLAGGGADVLVSTPKGKGWNTFLVATSKCHVPGCLRTAIGIDGSGQPIVAYSDGTSPMGVTPSAEAGWVASPIEEGAGGFGISLAVDADGNAHVSYYAGGSVHEAQTSEGGWQVSNVADVDPTSSQAIGGGTSVAVDGQGTTYVAWYDAGSKSIRLASAKAGTFTATPTAGTGGGAWPVSTVTSDGTTVYLGWYEATNQNLLLGTYASLTGLALANPSPTPTGVPTTSAPPTTSCKPSGTKLSITAQGTSFLTSCLAVPANQKFTVVLDNKDPIPHDFSIYPSSSQLTEADALLYEFTNPNPGSTSINYPGGPLKSGKYYFQCDFHPTQMFGTFIVK